MTAAGSLVASIRGRFGTILADPPWQFENRTGKMAPEHRRLNRYSTMSIQDIIELSLQAAASPAHIHIGKSNKTSPQRTLNSVCATILANKCCTMTLAHDCRGA